MGPKASAFIDAAVASGDHFGISSISLAEIVYLIEKSRLPSNAIEDLLSAIAEPRSVLQQIAVDGQVVLKMQTATRREVPDLPGRLIAATADLYDVPLLSGDARIFSARTIWCSSLARLMLRKRTHRMPGNVDELLRELTPEWRQAIESSAARLAEPILTASKKPGT